MKNLLKYILPAALALCACDRFDAVDQVFPNSVYLDVSATSQIQPATFGNRVESLTKELSVLLAYPAPMAVTASVTVDASLVQDYNHRYGTSYEMLPSSYLDFGGAKVTIEAGKTQSDKVTIALKGMAGDEDGNGAMEIDKTWLLPLRLASDDMKLMSGSEIAYYLVRRSSAITNAALLIDNWIDFPAMEVPGPVADAYNGLTALTYEALINVDRFDLQNDFGACNISSVMGVESYMCLRIGDTGIERQQLQFDGGGKFGKLPAKGDASKNLSSGQWYHVACTYDQAERVSRIYVDGKLHQEMKEAGSSTEPMTLAMRALGQAEAYPFRIGWSYNDFRPLQGKICEARVWKVARTQAQIWDNMYRIEDPESVPELIGYWKFDEGKGNVIKDYSASHNDGVAHSDITWPAGIEITEINKEED